MRYRFPGPISFKFAPCEHRRAGAGYPRSTARPASNFRDWTNCTYASLKRISNMPTTPWRTWKQLCGASTSSYAFDRLRSEEHTSELQSLMRTSYAVLCLKKKKNKKYKKITIITD